MKKIIFLILIMLGTIPAYSRSKSEALNNIIEVSEGINYVCPLTVSENLVMDQMKFNKSRNNLKIVMGIGSDSFVDSDFTPTQLDNMGRNIIGVWLTNENVMLRQMVEDLGQIGASVSIDFKNLRSGKVHHVNIDSEQIRSVIASRPSAESLLDNQLQTFIDSERAQIGVPLANGLVTTDIQDRGDFVEFVFSCDESIINIDALRNNLTPDAMANILGNMMSDPVVMLEMKCFADNGRGIKYTYIGNTSNKKAEGIVPAERLASMTAN